MDFIGLVEAAQGDDVEALDSLFRKFNDMAFGYAFSLVGDSDTAEDVVQESVIDVVCNIRKLRIPRAFPSWYKAIIRRNCGIHKRHPPLKWVQAEDMDAFSSDAALPDGELERLELRKMVREYIDRLSQTIRETTILHYFGDYSIEEIAEFLGIPLNTVKTRLFQARKRLKKGMETAMTEYLQDNVAREFPYRSVIQGVGGIYRERIQNRFFEDSPLCSCLRATLEAIGDGRGQGYETVGEERWYYDRAYAWLMGTTGLAFRFTWKKSWDIGIVSAYLIGKKADTVFERAYRSIGYSYGLLRTRYSAKEKSLSAREKKELRETAKRIVMENIDKKRPVIAHGVIGPPEECLITGYDEDGEAVTGWNVFQDPGRGSPSWYADTDGDGVMELNADRLVGYEPSGYFRKHDWFKDTWSVMYVVGKEKEPERGAVCRDSLEWALEVIRKDKLYIREFENGISAYRACADSVERLKIGADKPEELRSRYMVFVSAVAMIIDNRTYARLFLNGIAEEYMEISKPLSVASELYMEEIRSVWRIWNLLGIRKEGPEAWPSVKRDHDIGRSLALFADAVIRSECAGIIRGAVDFEIGAAEAIEAALREWRS